MSHRILIVEDEPGLVRILSDLLVSSGYDVRSERDGRSGLQRAAEEPFDLLVLDWMLPGLDGVEVCRAVRDQGFDGAILMLTARGQVADRVKGLRTGADDYIVKPFDADELLARVTALLRRARKAGLSPVSRFEFGDVVVDFGQGDYSKGGRRLEFAAKELELLRLLINRRGQVLTRETILKHVWKAQPFITERTVDVHIAWLRQKIEDNSQSPRHILTVRGEGYRFEN